ncbi:MAG TPA: SRPBCC domain-containing protein [Chitinophagaceae bacterium]|nr:SRPBCC domain-containing protein [Chitinophagaceae bacterium]
MKPYHWNQFTKRITIKAPAKAIYDAWTTQQGLESWFLRLSQFTQPGGTLRAKNSNAQAGDTYKWLWHGYPDAAVEQNEILSANGWDQMKFSFSGGCIVTVSIKQENNETICELIQDMPMEDMAEQQHFYIECSKGWTFYMTNLKSILEGGIDLRNKNLNIESVINS